MPKTAKPIPAYIPWGTFTDFIGHLKSAGVVPSRIDKSLMTHLPPLTRGQLVTTLRFLDLIDNDGSTANGALQQLVESFDTDDWSGGLKDHVAPRYKEILGNITLEQATPEQIAECFGRVCEKDMMRQKSERFFLSLLTAAKIPFSPHLLKRAATKRARTRTNGRPRKPARRRQQRGQTAAPSEAQAESNDEGPKTMAGYLTFPLPRGRSMFVPAELSDDDVKTITAYLNAFVGIRDE